MSLKQKWKKPVKHNYNPHMDALSTEEKQDFLPYA